MKPSKELNSFRILSFEYFFELRVEAADPEGVEIKTETSNDEMNALRAIRACVRSQKSNGVEHKASDSTEQLRLMITIRMDR